MAEQMVILVAEDDEADVFLLERALKLANIEASLQFVSDGQYAIEYLLDRAFMRTASSIHCRILQYSISKCLA